MKNNKFLWILVLVISVALVILPLVLFLPFDKTDKVDPWANVPNRPTHTDHTNLISGTFETGQEVTQACLECHPETAGQVMSTAHWTWESKPIEVPGRDEPVTVGKKNQINNFCIGIQGNWQKCVTCHAGYGWEDETFHETATEDQVDCLVCHAGVGTYAKGDYGLPLEGIDLTIAAQSVGVPTRQNCGSCHFNGGGGNAVKHGDLDESLYWPSASLDVHMGEHNFQCIDCHQTEDHNIKGRSISVSLDNENQVYCTDCHSTNMHEDERLNAHLDTVACQTCHIPQFALEDPTKVEWRWSEAGQDIGDDPHVYLKIKGSFVYASDVQPQYLWYNGVADRYLLGDPIAAEGPTAINYPKGDINDPTAKIMPFKVHVADQIYDTVNNYLIQPKTVGEGGYWTEFDWQLAATLGSQITGLPYSGSYGFTETIMFWPTTHMVQPVSEALQCTACHSEDGRLDWLALGYPGDPIEWGSRFENGN
ncbi:MAG: tetrathionate reductase family octaheme c-type cytochrome [Anaerolineales bacterium]|nr:tetrathionate reductase family octaheme c-type cytochrome [Anaerolineales bacterium]